MNNTILPGLASLDVIDVIGTPYDTTCFQMKLGHDTRLFRTVEGLGFAWTLHAYGVVEVSMHPRDVDTLNELAYELYGGLYGQRAVGLEIPTTYWRHPIDKLLALTRPMVLPWGAFVFGYRRWAQQRCVMSPVDMERLGCRFQAGSGELRWAVVDDARAFCDRVAETLITAEMERNDTSWSEAVRYLGLESYQDQLDAEVERAHELAAYDALVYHS